MHPNLCVLLSVCCYAIAAVVLEQRLARFDNSLMVAGLGGSICVLALVNYAITRDASAPVNFPYGVFLLWLMVAYVAWYFADNFYMKAYTNGGNLYTITIIGMLFIPVAAVLRFICTHEWPTRYHVAAYVLGCAMVALTIYGNEQLK